MTKSQEFPVQILSPNIRNSDRITVQVAGVTQMPDALKLVREWAEDVAKHDDMTPAVTETATLQPVE